MERIEEKNSIVHSKNGEDNMFLSLFENSINAIILGIPDGTILEANGAALEMFEYSLDELRNLGRKTIFDHTDPGMISFLKMRESEGKAKGIIIGIRKNGERFPCEFSSAIFYTENGEQRTSTILIDITERRKTEEEMALLIHNTEESFVLIDKQHKIVSFNKQFATRYETLLAKKVVKGDSILDFAQSERRETVKVIYERVFNGEIVDDEIVISLKDHPDTIFSIRYKPALDHSGNVIGAFVTSRDITEKRKAQELIITNEKRFRSIIEHAGDMISLTDVNGKLIYVSPSIEKMMGYSKDELINKSYKFTVHPDHIEESKLAFEQILETPGVPIPRVTRIMHKDGHFIWVEGIVTNLLQDDSIKAIVSNYRDISEKIAINQQKEYERKDKEALINSTEDLIWSVSRDFLLIAGNCAFVKTLNKYSGNLFKPGDNVLAGNFFHKDFILFWKDLYERALKGESVKQETYSPEEENVAPTWFEMNLNPIFDEGQIVGVACFGRNITDKKNAQFEREQIIAELSRNNSDLKQFSYVTSHNLRAPIANLLGLTSLMDHYPVSDPSLKQILDGIKQSALMFDETVKDLSKVLIIKDQSNNLKEQISLEQMVDKTLKQLGIKTEEKDVDISWDFSNAPQVTFTGSYLESVFMNLFTNAFKYRSQKKKLKIEINSINENEYIIVEFKDNGIGIDLEKYGEKIFKLYQRFHENSEGKGLGLYLVRSQLEALGNTIDIESEVGKGTTFILKFKKES